MEVLLTEVALGHVRGKAGLCKRCGQSYEDAISEGMTCQQLRTEWGMNLAMPFLMASEPADDFGQDDEEDLDEDVEEDEEEEI